MGLHKIFRIVVAVLAIVGMIFGAMIMSTPAEEISESTASVNNMMYVTYTVLFIVLALVVLFTLKNMFSNPDTLKRTLKGLGAFAAVALICYYGLANGVETDLRDGEKLSANGSKLVGAGLYMFYALALIASGTILFTAVKKMIK
jgi:NADH:ubiquinone oxidoreductase subunit 6 (subunit J)